MSGFDGRLVLVTGAASGIGAVVAARFAEAGARVVVSDIDIAGAERVAAELRGAIATRLDVTDAGEIRSVVAELGAVDVLVNNAVYATDTPFEQVTPAGWKREVDVALTGPFLLSQAVLPGMVAAGRGAIVNVSSVNAVTYLGDEAYSAAKAGLLSLTRSIAVRYGPRGVRCNAVLPGTIRTPVWESRLAVRPDLLDRVVKWYPLGRVGTPDDVAAAVLFLAGDQAAWITGVALPVDGGLLAGNAVFTEEIVIAGPDDDR